jgi:hypothetical protein
LLPEPPEARSLIDERAFSAEAAWDAIFSLSSAYLLMLKNIQRFYVLQKFGHITLSWLL